ncbi:MAG TPA: HAD-IA family hydrolase [Xanthobacteraceae bacterium]|nr:HAD-IA family hydrolase [Xanthobacteraceae bacterium]
MTSALPLLVFDLDGTLVDTAPDLVNALNTVFTREGFPALPYEEARLMIGGGLRPFIEKALAAEDAARPDGTVERLFREMVDYYSEHIADASRPFEGLADTLDHLAGDGFRFAVCTNKLEGLSVKLLKALNLAGRFDAICGADTFGISKPNPDVLRQTIAAAGGAGPAIMIGDSMADVATARAAGLPVIGVSFGYTDIPMAEIGPDRLIHHFEHLPPAVHALSAKWP